MDEQREAAFRQFTGRLDAWALQHGALPAVSGPVVFLAVVPGAGGPMADEEAAHAHERYRVFGEGRGRHTVQISTRNTLRAVWGNGALAVLGHGAGSLLVEDGLHRVISRDVMQRRQMAFLFVRVVGRAPTLPDAEFFVREDRHGASVELEHVPTGQRALVWFMDSSLDAARVARAFLEALVHDSQRETHPQDVLRTVHREDYPATTHDTRLPAPAPDRVGHVLAALHNELNSKPPA